MRTCNLCAVEKHNLEDFLKKIISNSKKRAVANAKRTGKSHTLTSKERQILRVQETRLLRATKSGVQSTKLQDLNFIRKLEDDIDDPEEFSRKLNSKVFSEDYFKYASQPVNLAYQKMSASVEDITNITGGNADLIRRKTQRAAMSNQLVDTVAKQQAFSLFADKIERARRVAENSGLQGEEKKKLFVDIAHGRTKPNDIRDIYEENGIDRTPDMNYDIRKTGQSSVQRHMEIRMKSVMAEANRASIYLDPSLIALSGDRFYWILGDEHYLQHCECEEYALGGPYTSTEIAYMDQQVHPNCGCYVVPDWPEGVENEGASMDSVVKSAIAESVTSGDEVHASDILADTQTLVDSDEAEGIEYEFINIDPEYPYINQMRMFMFGDGEGI